MGRGLTKHWPIYLGDSHPRPFENCHSLFLTLQYQSPDVPRDSPKGNSPMEFDPHQPSLTIVPQDGDVDVRASSLAFPDSFRDDQVERMGRSERLDMGCKVDRLEVLDQGAGLHGQSVLHLPMVDDGNWGLLPLG